MSIGYVILCDGDDCARSSPTYVSGADRTRGLLAEYGWYHDLADGCDYCPDHNPIRKAAARARVAYLENELDEEKASAASIRAAYDVLAMGGKAPESVPVRSDRVWWLHRCVDSNPALTWFSDLVAADVPRPERCPSCGTAADEGWFNVAKFDRLPEE